MANALFDKGREGFLDGSIDWDTNDIRIILVDEGTDNPNTATDDNLDDIGAGARVAVSNALDSPTVTSGVADAADEVLSAVSGATVEDITIYKHTGTESTSRLIAKIDTATGLPLTPNGGDVTVAWDNGANKIFKL
jgi:hypothetical protein